VDWPLPNYDQSSTRATFESKINSGNIDQLTEAWQYELRDSGCGKYYCPGAAATTPIVIDGTVYIGDLLTNVHALDLETGLQRWVVTVDARVIGPSGVVVGWGKVFANKKGTQIAAYDKDNGEELWATSLGGRIYIQPTLVDDKVLAATAGAGGPGSRGRLFALDQETGDVLWSFDTIESDDLWGHPEINSGGGTWYPPSVDILNRVSYWGIANPYPYPGTAGYPAGSSRPGDNKWTNSILAIDLDTGGLRWGHQWLAHDLFDRDTVLTAVADLEGEPPRQVIVSTGKLGRVMGLDPDGTVLWDTLVGMHKNDDVVSFEGALEVLPGPNGGVITPIALADGVVYASVVNAPETYPSPEQRGSEGGPDYGTFNSQFVAVDARNGDILWDIDLPGDSFGGATVANDLVFTSMLDGLIVALDRATGETTWTYQASGAINGWPAVVEDKLIIPIGYGNPPVLLALELPN
jgi:alcohol dehydrogenase (cytochrome c)